jgi:biotin operon repressor
MSTKEKMLKVLQSTRGVAFTTRQARRRFGISGVAQRIHDLRNDGYDIRTYTNDRGVTGYRLARR